MNKEERLHNLEQRLHELEKICRSPSHLQIPTFEEKNTEKIEYYKYLAAYRSKELFDVSAKKHVSPEKHKKETIHPPQKTPVFKGWSMGLSSHRK